MATGLTTPLVEGPRAKASGYSYRQKLGIMPSAEYIVFHDDFVNDVTSNVPTGWDAAIIDTGCTVTNAGLVGGQLLFDSDAANEGAAIYLPKFVHLAGKRFFMEAKVRMEDVSAMTFQMGVSGLTATTNPEDIWTTTTTDYISFGNLDTATAVLTYDKDNGGTVTETSSGSAATLADDTWAVLAIAYDGRSSPADSSVRAYVNGQQVAAAQTEAQIPDDLALAPFVGMLAGHATTADVAHVDYVRICLER